MDVHPPNTNCHQPSAPVVLHFANPVTSWLSRDARPDSHHSRRLELKTKGTSIRKSCCWVTRDHDFQWIRLDTSTSDYKLHGMCHAWWMCLKGTSFATGLALLKRTTTEPCSLTTCHCRGQGQLCQLCQLITPIGIKLEDLDMYQTYMICSIMYSWPQTDRSRVLPVIFPFPPRCGQKK